MALVFLAAVYYGVVDDAAMAEDAPQRLADHMADTLRHNLTVVANLKAHPEIRQLAAQLALKEGRDIEDVLRESICNFLEGNSLSVQLADIMTRHAADSQSSAASQASPDEGLNKSVP